MAQWAEHKRPLSGALHLHPMQLSLPGQVPETGGIPKEALEMTVLLGAQTLESLT